MQLKFKLLRRDFNYCSTVNLFSKISLITAATCNVFGNSLIAMKDINDTIFADINKNIVYGLCVIKQWTLASIYYYYWFLLRLTVGVLIHSQTLSLINYDKFSLNIEYQALLNINIFYAVSFNWYVTGISCTESFIIDFSFTFVDFKFKNR